MRKGKATNVPGSDRPRGGRVKAAPQGADSQLGMRGFLQRTVPFERPGVTIGLTFVLALGADLASKVLAIAYDVDGKVVVYNDRPGMFAFRVFMSLVALAVTYGVTGGILSVVVAAVSAYVRERRLPPPVHGLD